MTIIDLLVLLGGWLFIVLLSNSYNDDDQEGGTVKDFIGNDLRIGDRVVFADFRYNYANLKLGIVIRATEQQVTLDNGERKAFKNVLSLTRLEEIERDLEYFKQKESEVLQDGEQEENTESPQ